MRLKKNSGSLFKNRNNAKWGKKSCIDFSPYYFNGGGLSKY